MLRILQRYYCDAGLQFHYPVSMNTWSSQLGRNFNLFPGDPVNTIRSAAFPFPFDGVPYNARSSAASVRGVYLVIVVDTTTTTL